VQFDDLQSELAVQLKNTRLRDIYLEDYNHAWTLANITDTTRTEGWVYPLIYYTNQNEKDLSLVELNRLYLEVFQFPAVFIHTLFRRIFQYVGYSVSSRLLDDGTNVFNKLVEPFTSGNWSKDGVGPNEGVDRRVDVGLSGNLPIISDNTWRKIPFDVESGAGVSYFDTLTSRYTPDIDLRTNFILGFQLATVTGSSGAIRFRIYNNTTSQEVVAFNGGGYAEQTSPKIYSGLTAGTYTWIVQDANLCQKSGSELQIWITGSKIASASDASSFSTKNDALVFIGTNGNKTAFFTGSIAQVMIFASALTSSTTVSNLSSSLDNSPNVGNVIYEHGMVIITKPGSYQNFLLSGSSDSYTVSFSSSIQTTEQRYKCKIEPDEFDFTYNPSTFDNDGNIKNTFTSSLSPLSTGSFSPYITTIGLHNENGDLVAVGKLGQPVKKSTKTPLNFIVKYDL
jgi:hypothetical protein